MQRLTVTGKGERLSEVLTDDRHLHTDPQALMELFVANGGRPHEAGVLRAVTARVRRAQPEGKETQTGERAAGGDACKGETEDCD